MSATAMAHFYDEQNNQYAGINHPRQHDSCEYPLPAMYTPWTYTVNNKIVNPPVHRT